MNILTRFVVLALAFRFTSNCESIGDQQQGKSPAEESSPSSSSYDRRLYRNSPYKDHIGVVFSEFCKQIFVNCIVQIAAGPVPTA
jgi:hypothetical protein